MEQRFKKQDLKKIKVAVTGPESTGKSILSIQLARYFNTLCNPEYAREYFVNYSGVYSLSDVEQIAKVQFQREFELFEEIDQLLICDTDALVIKIWMEFKFNEKKTWINQWFENGGYDLFLLCDIDIPWQPDPLRENPHERKQLLDMYLNYLNTNNKKFIIVSGNEEVRFQKSIEQINKLLFLPINGCNLII